MSAQFMNPGHGHKDYLASKDDNFVDCPRSLILQELADDAAACSSGPDDSKILATRHVLVEGIWDGSMRC